MFDYVDAVIDPCPVCGKKHKMKAQTKDGAKCLRHYKEGDLINKQLKYIRFIDDCKGTYFEGHLKLIRGRLTNKISNIEVFNGEGKRKVNEMEAKKYDSIKFVMAERLPQHMRRISSKKSGMVAVLTRFDSLPKDKIVPVNGSPTEFIKELGKKEGITAKKVDKAFKKIKEMK